MELLAEKDGVPRPGGNMFNDFGSPPGHMGGQGNGMDISVPRQGVGLVIGKKGEMIQKIQNETGAKVQFKTGNLNSFSGSIFRNLKKTRFYRNIRNISECSACY